MALMSSKFSFGSRVPSMRFGNRGRHSSYASGQVSLTQRTSASPSLSSEKDTTGLPHMSDTQPSSSFLPTIPEGRTGGSAGILRRAEDAFARAGAEERGGELCAGRRVRSENGETPRLNGLRGIRRF